MTHAERQHRFRVALAFGLVYLIWGSTYLGMRIAVEQIPAALMTGVRFLIAGPLMLSISGIQGRRIALTRDDFRKVAVVGILLLTGGNMLVAWAEVYVASGLAALIVAIVPLWVTVIEAGVLRGDRLRARGFLGLGFGIVGLIVLLWPDLRAGNAASKVQLTGVLILIGATISWAAGSVLSRRWDLKIPGLVAAGWETTIGGVVNLVLAFALGEPHRAVWTLRGAGAILYLVIFGSLIGFSSYIWLLDHVPTAKVATYAYVNPVVAVFLGWLVLNEPITGYILAGSLIIIASVALVNSSKIKSTPAEGPQPAPEDMPAYEPGG